MKPNYKITYAFIAATAFFGTPALAQEEASENATAKAEVCPKNHIISDELKESKENEDNGQQPETATPDTPVTDTAAEEQQVGPEHQTIALADMPLDELKKSAEAGDAEAQTELAERYFTGKDVPADAMLAIQQLANPVQQNNPKAQTLLGACYYSGTGVALDYSVALEWFNRAAISGYAPALMCLYAAYRDGRGVATNYTIAMQWLEKAVAAKSQEAMCEMALIRLRGKLGTQVNVEAARAILEEAHSLGSKQAEKMLQLLDEAYAK